MIKIVTYSDRKGGFSRRADGTVDEDEKKKGKILSSEERIYAEQELDDFIREGWQILSSSTYAQQTNMMGSTIAAFTYLTVVLHKDK